MRNIILLSLSLIAIVSCKNETTIEDFKDKYIKKIDQNTIYAMDGTTFNIPFSDSTRIYYLIRHAEKDTIKSNDPPLSDLGDRRAGFLYDILRGTKIDNIFSTMFIRTLTTVDSLASMKGMGIKAYNGRDLRALHATIVDSLDSKINLVVGHSNSTPVLANFLSGQDYFTSSFSESDYDNFLVIIETGKNKKELLPLRYKP